MAFYTLRRLSTPAFSGVRLFIEMTGWLPGVCDDGLEPWDQLLDEADLRRLIEALKVAEEGRGYFPHGKWATIQFLQSWLPQEQ
jgi:hypothetical protein